MTTSRSKFSGSDAHFRRYFIGTNETSRRQALNEWLRRAAADGSTASRARRLFEIAEGRLLASPGEVAQARGEMDGQGIVVTGAEGL